MNLQPIPITKSTHKNQQCTLLVQIEESRICFSKKAQEVLNVAPGDRIELVHDLEEPHGMYLRKAVGENGLPVRKNAKNHYCFGCAGWAKTIWDRSPEHLRREKSVTLLLSEAPINNAYEILFEK